MQHQDSYILDPNTLDSDDEIVQKVRWVIICRDADAQVRSADGRI